MCAKLNPDAQPRPSQRDRPLIKHLLMEIDRYCARNLQEREDRAEAERIRQHEAQHVQQVGSHNELHTAGDAPGGEGSKSKDAGAAEEEETKEVDPSLVGSLDDVYQDEPGAMMSEDPFKRVPVMDPDHENASLKQMEKEMDALAVYSEEDSLTPAEGECLLDEECTSLDSGVRRPVSSPSTPPGSVGNPLDSRLNNVVGIVDTEPTRDGRGSSEDLLPDVVDSTAAVSHNPGQGSVVGAHRDGGEHSAGSPPDIQVSSRGAPDVASGHPSSSRLPLDIAVGARQSLDLLDHTVEEGRGSSQPVDLTDGLLARSSAHNS